MTLDLAALTQTLTDYDAVRVTGFVRSVVGLCVRADLPDARIGELVTIERRGQAHESSAPHEPLLAEVVGFDERGVALMPLGAADGLGPDDEITPERAPLSVRFGADLLGRQQDGRGGSQTRVGAQHCDF